MKTVLALLLTVVSCFAQTKPPPSLRGELLNSVTLGINELVWAGKWCRYHNGKNDYATMRDGERVSCDALQAYTVGYLQETAATMQLISAASASDETLDAKRNDLEARMKAIITVLCKYIVESEQRHLEEKDAAERALDAARRVLNRK